jgi:hypothetical protein
MRAATSDLGKQQLPPVNEAHAVAAVPTTNLGEIKTLLGKGIPGTSFSVQSGPIPFIQTWNEKWMALELSKMGAPK